MTSYLGAKPKSTEVISETAGESEDEKSLHVSKSRRPCSIFALAILNEVGALFLSKPHSKLWKSKWLETMCFVVKFRAHGAQKAGICKWLTCLEKAKSSLLLLCHELSFPFKDRSLCRPILCIEKKKLGDDRMLYFCQNLIRFLHKLYVHKLRRIVNFQRTFDRRNKNSKHLDTPAVIQSLLESKLQRSRIMFWFHSLHQREWRPSQLVSSRLRCWNERVLKSAFPTLQSKFEEGLSLHLKNDTAAFSVIFCRPRKAFLAPYSNPIAVRSSETPGDTT